MTRTLCKPEIREREREREPRSKWQGLWVKQNPGRLRWPSGQPGRLKPWSTFLLGTAAHTEAAASGVRYRSESARGPVIK